MFKLTKSGSGLRRASANGQTGRVSGLHGLRGRDITTDNLRRPAFVPPTRQEQGFDNDLGRVSEIGKG